jgi:phosphopantothenate--cysteine ligase
MNILITSGGTSEKIDQVRKITNMSRGNLGKEICNYAVRNPNVNQIFYLSPSYAFPSFKDNKLTLVECDSVADLSKNLQHILKNEKIDVVIHSMAISDYTVDFLFSMESLSEHLAQSITNNPSLTQPEILEILTNGSYGIDSSSKVSSSYEDLCIKLKKTEKIISKIKEWSPTSKLVGFKLLNNVSKDELLSVALKLKEKNQCDYVWANDIHQIRQKGHCGYFVYNKEYIEEIEGIENISKYIIDTVVTDSK